MNAQDFSAWLSGVGRLSAAQRIAALAALSRLEGAKEGARSSGTGSGSPPEASLSGDSRRRPRPDALGTSSHEQVSAQGCPHCAGGETIAWGRANGLSRFRCKGCGRTFNALTRTPLARLRKKDRWLDHARAMIEGRSLAKTAELCGVHPTTAFRWRHRFLGSGFLGSPAPDKS